MSNSAAKRAHRTHPRRLPAAAVVAQTPSTGGGLTAGGSEDGGWVREEWATGYANAVNSADPKWLEVEGQVPAELCGTLFRNGPGKFSYPSGESVGHPFDGDGYMLSVGFEGGRAFSRGRYIETPGFLAEEKAGKILYRGTFGTKRAGGPLANAFDLENKAIANTNVVYWGGKLLALWEASQPFALEPDNLASRGVDLLGGTLSAGMPFATGVEPIDDFLKSSGSGMAGNPFSAHPHLDSVTGNLVGFGYQVRPDLSTPVDPFQTVFSFYEFDPSFKLAHKVCTATLPGFAFVHDFCFTETHYIIFQNPVKLDMVPFIAGMKGPGECLAFDKTLPTKAWFIPRPGSPDFGQKPKVIDCDPCFVFHHANAYNDPARPGRVVVDSVRLPELVDFGELSALDDFRTVDFESTPTNTLWRFEFDLAAGGGGGRCVSATELSTRIVEFPAVSPRVFGQRHRFVYCGAARHPTRNQPLQGVLKTDMDSGEQFLFRQPSHKFQQEPIFVPRAGGAEEDDGWVIAVVHDGKRSISEVQVFDAKAVQDGPVATVNLGMLVPYGLHSTFVQDKVFNVPCK